MQKRILPIALRMKGVDKMELTKFLSAPDGGKPAYYRMAELYFAGPAKCSNQWVHRKDKLLLPTLQILQQAE